VNQVFLCGVKIPLLFLGKGIEELILRKEERWNQIGI